MFLTAQRVVDRFGSSGVGVYAYTHDNVMVAAPRDEATFAHYSEVEPGRCIFASPARRVEIGGATVLSFLDVLAPDAAPLTGVLSQLDVAILSMPRGGPVDSFWTVGPLALRFYANPALAPVASTSYGD